MPINVSIDFQDPLAPTRNWFPITIPQFFECLLYARNCPRPIAYNSEQSRQISLPSWSLYPNGWWQTINKIIY